MKHALAVLVLLASISDAGACRPSYIPQIEELTKRAESVHVAGIVGMRDRDLARRIVDFRERNKTLKDAESVYLFPVVVGRAGGFQFEIMSTETFKGEAMTAPEWAAWLDPCRSSPPKDAMMHFYLVFLTREAGGELGVYLMENSAENIARIKEVLAEM